MKLSMDIEEIVRKTIETFNHDTKVVVVTKDDSGYNFEPYTRDIEPEPNERFRLYNDWAKTIMVNGGYDYLITESEFNELMEILWNEQNNRKHTDEEFAYFIDENMYSCLNKNDLMKIDVDIEERYIDLLIDIIYDSQEYHEILK